MKDIVEELGSPAERDVIVAGREQVRQEYRRRARLVDSDKYAPWQPAIALNASERVRVAAQMLHHARVFPNHNDPCLEIGCGALGWLAEFINWGVEEQDLHAVDIFEPSVEVARRRLPTADIRLQDATSLPWPAGTFKIVIASTVFSSVPSEAIRRLVAAEITRVLAPGGALLWYDLACNNPANPNVRRIPRNELRQLFPGLSGEIRRVTLAPPVARMFAPFCWTLAVVLSALPFLRTHLLGVLIKPRS